MHILQLGRNCYTYSINLNSALSLIGKVKTYARRLPSYGFNCNGNFGMCEVKKIEYESWKDILCYTDLASLILYL